MRHRLGRPVQAVQGLQHTAEQRALEPERSGSGPEHLQKDRQPSGRRHLHAVRKRIGMQIYFLRQGRPLARHQSNGHRQGKPKLWLGSARRKVASQLNGGIAGGIQQLGEPYAPSVPAVQVTRRTGRSPVRKCHVCQRRVVEQ